MFDNPVIKTRRRTIYQHSLTISEMDLLLFLRDRYPEIPFDKVDIRQHEVAGITSISFPLTLTWTEEETEQ